MDRSRWVAVITGVISLLLAVGYLVLVQLLDFRGEMVPAPLSIAPLSLRIWTGPGILLQTWLSSF